MIGRLASRKIGLSSDYITTLTYVPGNGTNKTTGLVSTYRNGSWCQEDGSLGIVLKA